jgi:hypothetical protein
MKTAKLLLAIAMVALSACWAMAEDAKTLRIERKPGQVDRVEIRLEVGGETKFTEGGKKKDEKMSVACDLVYAEKTLETPVEGAWRSVRDYQKVSTEVKVGDGLFQPTLKPEHRLIAVEVTPRAATLFSPQGRLTRDELDAVDIQANTLLLDRLLPEKAIAVGDTWEHSGDFMAAFLGLDEVAKTDVKSTLKEKTATVARFEINGDVEGAVYGVPTKIEVKGRYRMDLRSHRIDWVGLLVKENRVSSFVADGVDVVSRLSIKVAPTAEPAALADKALASLTLKPTPELTYLMYEAPSGQWECPYDRRWYIHHQRPKIDVAVLRLVDRGMLAGQCNVSSLPQKKREDLVSLEDFQKDIRAAVGKKRFGEFVEAKQWVNDGGNRVYRVVVDGTDADIAMRWIYYLIADPQGRQVAFTFAVEREWVERFAEADKPLVDSLRFADKTDAKKSTANASQATDKR